MELLNNDTRHLFPGCLDKGWNTANCEKYVGCHIENRKAINEIDNVCELKMLSGGMNILSSSIARSSIYLTVAIALEMFTTSSQKASFDLLS